MQFALNVMENWESRNVVDSNEGKIDSNFFSWIMKVSAILEKDLFVSITIYQLHVLDIRSRQDVSSCSSAGMGKSCKLRSSHWRCSVKISVLKNFEKFTEKNLCRNFLFNKIATLRPATLLKKRLQHSCFPVNFAKFLK